MRVVIRPATRAGDELLADDLRILGALTLVNLPVMLLLLVGLATVILPGAILSIPAVQESVPLREASIAAMVCMVIGLLLYILSFLLTLPLMMAQSAVISHVVLHNSFRAVFQIHAWWDVLRAGWKIFLIESLVVLCFIWIGSLFLALPIATLILICLYPFLVAIYFFFVTLYHHTLAALAYRQSLALQAGNRQ